MVHVVRIVSIYDAFFAKILSNIFCVIKKCDFFCFENHLTNWREGGQSKEHRVRKKDALFFFNFFVPIKF